MGRFSRRRTTDTPWLSALPDRFTLEDLTARTTPETFRQALSWLYAGIERGRITPHQTDDGMRYELGRRRAADQSASSLAARADVPSAGRR
jgi:hypothetical protein